MYIPQSTMQPKRQLWIYTLCKSRCHLDCSKAQAPAHSVNKMQHGMQLCIDTLGTMLCNMEDNSGKTHCANHDATWKATIHWHTRQHTMQPGTQLCTHTIGNSRCNLEENSELTRSAQHDTIWNTTLHHYPRQSKMQHARQLWADTLRKARCTLEDIYALALGKALCKSLCNLASTCGQTNAAKHDATW
jgi:hypothetical protein